MKGASESEQNNQIEEDNEKNSYYILPNIFELIYFNEKEPLKSYFHILYFLLLRSEIFLL